MNPPVVCFLADAPAHVDTLARWHHAEWGHLYSDWSLDAARAELADHACRRDRPTTLVLEQGGRLLGSVSLVDEDAAEFSDFGEPWLASLYVAPEARGRGHGAALVRALVAHADAVGVARLFLFTPGQRDFYERLGWQAEARADLNGVTVDLMSCAP